MISSKSKHENSKIKSVSIKNYKGFFDEQKAYFAEPDGKNQGSGLTIITGSNNSGKTSILEAISLTPSSPGKMALPDAPQGNNNPSIVINTTTDTFRYYYQVKKDEPCLPFKERDNKIPDYKIAVIPTQRTSLDNLSNLRNNFGTTDSLLVMLKNIQKGSEETKEQFNELIREIIPNFKSWEISENLQKNNSKNFYLVNYKTNDGLSHAIDFSGIGVISIFRICAYLILETSVILVIDEPELSLHPSAQKNLRKILSRYSKERQIIVTTHSPYFIDWDDFSNKASFICTRINQGRCIVHHLNNNSTSYSDFIKKTSNSWKRPHMLDLVTKEVFFSNKLLLVEGQEDVGLIKNWLRNEYKKDLPFKYTPSFEIWGYGAGGVNNILKFLDMATDLGINKVGVLTDELKEENDIRSFVEWKSRNKQHNYKFQELLTADIRTKINIDVEQFIEKCVNQKTGKLKDSRTIINDIERCIKISNERYFDTKGSVIKCSNCQNTSQIDDKCYEACKNNSLTKIFKEFDEYFEEDASGKV